MKSWLRRWLMHLLHDDVFALIQAALDDAEIRTFLDGEEISRIADRQVMKALDAVTRATWGKD